MQQDCVWGRCGGGGCADLALDVKLGGGHPLLHLPPGVLMGRGRQLLHKFDGTSIEFAFEHGYLKLNVRTGGGGGGGGAFARAPHLGLGEQFAGEVAGLLHRLPLRCQRRSLRPGRRHLPRQVTCIQCFPPLLSMHRSMGI